MNYSNLDARLSQGPRLSLALVERMERLREVSRKARTLQEKMALAAQIGASLGKTSGPSRG